MAFLGIPDYRIISKLHGINMRLGNKSTPRNHLNTPLLANPHVGREGVSAQQIPRPLSDVVPALSVFQGIHPHGTQMLVQFFLGCGRFLAKKLVQVLNAVFNQSSHIFDLALD